MKYIIKTCSNNLIFYVSIFYSDRHKKYDWHPVYHNNNKNYPVFKGSLISCRKLIQQFPKSPENTLYKYSIEIVK